MTSNNNNDQRKVEEEVESSAVARKRLRLSDNDSSNETSGELEEETEEEVSSEESSMNQLDPSEEKLMAKRSCGFFFSNDSDTSLTESEPGSTEMPSSYVHSDPNSSDNDDDDDF
jgi:hypothetical protein